ncbi:MAG: hypothetical protein HC800_03470 [Phormidesmis sp. RL_2_1]|nr:hypothetical protein [Phormidesmis sp. RL_2_1]
MITRALTRLLQHFGIHELDSSSDHQLAVLLSQFGPDQHSPDQHGPDQHSPDKHGPDNDDLCQQNSMLLAELRRRIVRLAGAQLDHVFTEIAPLVIGEDEAEAIVLSVESRQLQGLRFQNEVYRLDEAFAPCHRLQAFAWGKP